MKRLALAVLAATIACSTAANAACNQTDLTGIWQIYSTAWDNSGAWWSRCQVKINAGGTMSNGQCANSLGQSGPMTNGSATIVAAAACTFRAQFRLGGDLNRVVHATLSRDKTTGSGVGTFPGGKFNFTMSKR
jgi:hypothetical protein